MGQRRSGSAQLASLAITWLVPKFSGADAAVRHVINGWRFGSIYQYISGSPLAVSQTADGFNNGSTYEFPDFNYATNRYEVDTTTSSYTHRNHNEWFNTAGFSEAIGHYGSATRNFLVGTKTDPVTLSVSRTFGMPYNEKHNLEFRTEAFNAFNHPQWSTVRMSLRAAAASAKSPAPGPCPHRAGGPLKYLF